MTRRKRKPSLMLPVTSAMRPTIAGARKEADLSVREKREKKVDSWPCYLLDKLLCSYLLSGKCTGGISSAYTALE